MQHRIRGNEYRTTVVCVDSYEKGVLAGRFYNPYLETGEHFESLVQFLKQMEVVLDNMNLPPRGLLPRLRNTGPAARPRGNPRRGSWPPLRCGLSSGRTPAGRAPSPGWKRAGRRASAAFWS